MWLLSGPWCRFISKYCIVFLVIRYYVSETSHMRATSRFILLSVLYKFQRDFIIWGYTFCMGYFVAMETYVYVMFIDTCFCNVHSIGPISVCTNFEINRYKIDEFRKHAQILGFIWLPVHQPPSPPPTPAPIDVGLGRGPHYNTCCTKINIICPNIMVVSVVRFFRWCPALLPLGYSLEQVIAKYSFSNSLKVCLLWLTYGPPPPHRSTKAVPPHPLQTNQLFNPPISGH